MAAAAGRGRTRDKVGHTSVLWRGARVGILFLIIYTVILCLLCLHIIFFVRAASIDGLGALSGSLASLPNKYHHLPLDYNMTQTNSMCSSK